MSRPHFIKRIVNRGRGHHIYGWVQVTEGEWRWRRFGSTQWQAHRNFKAKTSKGTTQDGFPTRDEAQEWLLRMNEFGDFDGAFPPPNLSVAGGKVQS